MTIRRRCTERNCKNGRRRLEHLRFDVMYRGKRYRIPANEFAIPRMDQGKQRPIQSMEEARDWEWCVGLYGTMAYAVARRTREIGIRMALGARRGLVIWMVLREVCVLAALGLAISVPIALGTSRLIESFLFEMKPNDPRALALAVAILLSAALLAGYGPARRASRVDPMIALRHE
jgi:hypothetical protein